MNVLIAASCALAFAATTQSASAQSANGDEDECPPAFLGATVNAQSVPGGVRLEFRNGNRAAVSPMREQLRGIADLIELHGTELQTASEEEEVDFPPVDIEVKNISLGARVTVRATRLRDLPAIRELAYGFAEFWKTSPCLRPLLSVREPR